MENDDSDKDAIIPINSDNETEDAEPTGCCNPSHSAHRFLALMLMSLLSFGSYFCYDNPAALQDNFITDMGLTTSTFMYLYSLYSWPNIVMCFVGGFLIDRVFGIRLGTVIYSALVVFGQLIFALGGIVNAFWLMELGRFVFGIGAESLAVAQNSYAVLWFKGKELNMVFGLQMSISRLGSTFNFNIMEPLYSWVNQYYKGYTCIGVVLFIASVTCIMSLICALILAYLDRRAEKMLKRAVIKDGEVVRITDIKNFSAIFWMMTIVCITYAVAILPFIALAKVFFERKFSFTPEQANEVNSILYVISAVLAPFLGLMIDKVGKNILWLFLSVLITIGSHALLAFTYINPYYAVSIMGLAFSIFVSALWPMIALIIPEYQLGTAYGIVQSLANFGLATATLAAGRVVDAGGYLVLEVFFLAWLCLSLLTTIGIWVLDAKRNGTLNMTPSQREFYERNQLGAEVLERKKLLASGSMSDITPHDLFQPHSDFHI